MLTEFRECGKVALILMVLQVNWILVVRDEERSEQLEILDPNFRLELEQ